MYQDHTRIQPTFPQPDHLPTPAGRRRRALLAGVAAGLAVLTVGAVLVLRSEDTPEVEVAGAVLSKDTPVLATMAGGATPAGGQPTATPSAGQPAGTPSAPPAPKDQPATSGASGGQSSGGSSSGGQNGGSSGDAPSTPPAPTVPPTTPPTVPPTTPPTVPPTTPPTVPPTVPPAPGGPQLLASPLSLNYGTSTGNRTVTLKNTGGSTLQWSTTPNKAWLTVNPPVGSVAPGAEVAIEVKAQPTGDPGAPWSGSILFNSNGGSFAMPVSGTFKNIIVINPDLVAPVLQKPVIESVTVPPVVCKLAPIAVVAKVTGAVSSVKLERTLPNATLDMAYNPGNDTASKAFAAPGLPGVVVQVTVTATGPGGTAESAPRNVLVSPFC